MDQDKVNPFVGNTETPAGGSPVSAPSNPVGAPAQSAPSAPVNPYAPAGAPYAPGSNTPAPDYYNPSSDSPAVPNTSAPSAYTSFSPAPSQNFTPMDNPEKPKLFTKKFIIFAVIGLILIAGAVVAGILIQNNRKSGGNSATNNGQQTSNGGSIDEISSNNMKKYANYIVSGTDSTNNVQDLGNNTYKYFISGKLGDVFSPDIDVMKNMVSKWQAFSSSFSTNSEIFKKTVADYQKVVDFFKVYSENQPYTDEELLKIYQEGKDKTYLEERYEAYKTISDASNEYAMTQIEYGAAIFDKFDIYKKYGCLESSSLNLDCIERQKFSADENSILTKDIDYKHRSREIYSSQVGLITSDINFIYNAVTGSIEEQYEKEA